MKSGHKLANRTSILLVSTGLITLLGLALLLGTFGLGNFLWPGPAIPKATEERMFRVLSPDTYRNPEVEIIGYGQLPKDIDFFFDSVVCIKLHYETRLSDGSWRPSVRSIAVLANANSDQWSFKPLSYLVAKDRGYWQLHSCPGPFEAMN